MYYYWRWTERNCIIIPVEAIITQSTELTNMNYTNYTKFSDISKVTSNCYAQELKPCPFLRNLWPSDSSIKCPFFPTRMPFCFRFNRQDFIEQCMWKYQPHKISHFGLHNSVFYIPLIAQLKWCSNQPCSINPYILGLFTRNNLDNCVLLKTFY